MAEYNFLNLSPSEFEDLSRDLLQKHLNLSLESFTNGPDSGIDLRCCFPSGKKLIVQCKRYTDFNSLYSNLKIEVSKVSTLKPDRYILATSIGLTPSQKDKIFQLFNPHIRSLADIFGKNDLNNLLNQYPEVEKSHFKLWLSSAVILQKILYSKVLNQASFEEDKIKETARLYVENPSFYRAKEIIKNKNYVIISGIPGIGKTTLARILVYHYLGLGFEEFIFLSDSINDAYSVFKETTKQIFLFDDFLGRNFLGKKLGNNEEQLIVRFIEKVSKSPNKIIIFTTREYILAQAKLQYDSFENPSLNFAKCIIDLSEYTKLTKAKILYNHLFFANLELAYISNVLKGSAYFKIIEHPNYNPRVIETITHPDVWKTIQPDNFATKFISFLDYPESVWKHVYENQISKFSQCILANLLTAGTPIMLNHLKASSQKFIEKNSPKYGISFSEIDFHKGIKELENTFITIAKDSYNNLIIEYQNPSVQDFLVNYFKDLPDYIADLISSAIYFNQLFTVFAIDGYYIIGGKTVKRKNMIVLDGKTKSLYINKIMSSFDELSSSLISKSKLHYSDNAFGWLPNPYSVYKKLNSITGQFLLDEYPEIKNFVVARFQKVIKPENLDWDDFNFYINLIAHLMDECSFDENETLKLYSNSMYQLNHTSSFEKLEVLFPSEYKEFITTNAEFKSNIKKLMIEESDSAEGSNLQDVLDEIKQASKLFNVDSKDLEGTLKKRIKEFEDEQEESLKWKDDVMVPAIAENNNTDEEIEIMFASLWMK